MTEDSISNKLSELFDLFKSGALTKQEYESLKAKIINKDEVQPIIAKVQVPEHDIEVKKEVAFEQPYELNNKDLESKQSIVEPEAKSKKKFGKKAIIAIALFILIAFSFVLLVNRTTLFSDKSSLTGEQVQTVKDIDGNVYKTVTIGTQVWMAENLKTTKYNDGTPITLVTQNNSWRASSTPAYCWYNNDEITNKNTYGAIYNWHTVNTNKLCPTGWHIPSDSEWTILTDYLINNGNGYEGSGDDISKSLASTTGWNVSSEIGTVGSNPTSNNLSGFNAYASGIRFSNGEFRHRGENSKWWSSTETSTSAAQIRFISWDDGIVSSFSNRKENGFSVRCVRDLVTSKNNIPVNNKPIAENKTAIWDEAAATIIIMDKLIKHPWDKVDYIDTSKLDHKIIGFTKINLKDKDVIVGLTLSKNSNSERSGYPSIFEFDNQNGWKLEKNQIGFGESMENLNLYKIAQDNYCLITSRNEAGMGQSWDYKVLYAFINGELKKIFETPYDLAFITKIDGYYDIEVTQKGGQPELYKFNGNEYVQQ